MSRFDCNIGNAGSVERGDSKGSNVSRGKESSDGGYVRILDDDAIESYGDSYRKNPADMTFEEWRASQRKDKEDYLAMIDAKYNNKHLEKARDQYPKGSPGYIFYDNLIKLKEGITKDGEKFRQKISDMYAKNPDMDYKQIIMTVMEEDRIDTREKAVNKLVQLGFERDFAEKSVPENFDEQLNDARKEGVKDAENRFKGYTDYKGNSYNLTP